MLKFRHVAGVATLLLSTAALPALAAETIVAPFTTPSTGTTDLYSGQVRVTVSGTGFSNGQALNDAFYNVPSGSVEPSGYYQLGFGTSPLQPYTPTNAVVNFISGGRPTYDATNTYTFLLNAGSTATQLFFGVTDGQFQDNGGQFTINVTSVPEPATWGLMILGVGAVGFAMRRRGAVKTTVRYA